MAKKNQVAIPTKGDKVAYSWLPVGVEVDDVLAGAGWKPEAGDVKTFEVTGFQKREGENGEYLLVNGVDLQTGEMFTFAPGGLFAYMANEGKIVTGDKIAMRFKGTKKLASGFNANDWDIVKLKK
jgi:hypothetical protein